MRLNQHQNNKMLQRKKMQKIKQLRNRRRTNKNWINWQTIRNLININSKVLKWLIPLLKMKLFNQLIKHQKRLNNQSKPSYKMINSRPLLKQNQRKIWIQHQSIKTKLLASFNHWNSKKFKNKMLSSQRSLLNIAKNNSNHLSKIIIY